MSSMDSSILSSASMFSWNVYRPLRQISDTAPELQRVLRLSIVVLGAIAIALALTVQSVYQLWYLSSDLVYVILFPQLLTALFYRRTTPQAALAGVVVGVGLRVTMALLTSESVANLAGWRELQVWLSYFPWRTVAMLTSLSTILLLSFRKTEPAGR
jgi:high affinity choline transporter 7